MSEDFAVNPLVSMEIELKQILDFFEDIQKVSNQVKIRDCMGDIIMLRDETCRLRAEYSVVYSKLYEVK